jgi:MFS family permease
MNDTTPESSSRFHPNIYFLAVVSLLTDVSSEMLNNVLPLFLVNVLGARTVVVGLIDGIAETTASLVKIYSGSLSDRLGRRKPLAVLGYGLSTIAKPILYFASSWGWVLSVRIADRFGKGIRTAPRDALIADSVGPSRRGRAFGLHRAGDTAGAFLGLAIATLIIWLSQSGGAGLTRSTFQYIVLASIIPAVLAVLILSIFVKDVVSPKPNSASQVRTTGWKGLDYRFRRFLFVVVLFTLGNSSDSFIILRGQERGLSILQIMGMLLTFNAVYSLLSSPLGTLSDRLGRRNLILVGWFIYGLIYLGLAVSRSGIAIWALFGFYGVFYALTEGSAKALVADLVASEQRGTAYGFYNAAIGLTALPASLIAGILWQGLWGWTGLGPSAPFFFGAGMALLAGLLFKFWVPQQPAVGI